MDMATIKSFVALAQPEQLSMMTEIEKNFKNEFDYRNEARQLEQVSKNMKVFEKECHVPQPHLEHCTKRMLVMEMLKGKPLKKKLDEFLDSMARKEGMTREEFVEKMRADMMKGDGVDSSNATRMIQSGPLPHNTSPRPTSELSASATIPPNSGATYPG